MITDQSPLRTAYAIHICCYREGILHYECFPAAKLMYKKSLGLRGNCSFDNFSEHYDRSPGNSILLLNKQYCGTTVLGSKDVAIECTVLGSKDVAIECLSSVHRKRKLTADNEEDSDETQCENNDIDVAQIF